MSFALLVKTMKILITTDIYPPSIGGLSSAAYTLANTLAEKGHSVVVLATSQGLKIQKKMEKKVLVYRFPATTFPFYKETRLALPVISVPIIVQNIRREKPDLVHVLSFGSLGIPALIAAKTLGIPTVSTNHMLPGNMSAWFPFGKKLVEIIEKNVWGYLNFFLTRVDLVTVPSQFALKALKENTEIKEGYVISNGIEIPDNLIGREEAKKALGLEGKKVVLYVGRIAGDKSFEKLLEAFPRIKKEVKNTKLIFVGMGPLLKKYLEEAVEDVEFTGYVTSRKLGLYYQAADVFCMPSLVELQGLAPLEAASFGAPLVLADSAALPELIQDNGFLYEANNTTDLVQKVVKILKDTSLEEEFSKNSLKLSLLHSKEKVIEDYELVYQKALLLDKKRQSLRSLIEDAKERFKAVFK